MSIKEFDVGDTVICDLCGGNFTKSDRQGGIIFMSKGVCPDCTPHFLESVYSAGEETHIKAQCPTSMSFKDFILKVRGGNNKIRILSGEDAFKILKGKQKET